MSDDATTKPASYTAATGKRGSPPGPEGETG